MRWSVRMVPFALASHNAGSTQQAGVLDKTPPPSPPPTVCSSCSYHVVAQLGHLRQRSGDIATPEATSAGRVSTPSNSLMLLSHYRGGRGHAPSTLPISLSTRGGGRVYSLSLLSAPPRTCDRLGDAPAGRVPAASPPFFLSPTAAGSAAGGVRTGLAGTRTCSLSSRGA